MSSKKLYRLKKSVADADLSGIGIVFGHIQAALRGAKFRISPECKAREERWVDVLGTGTSLDHFSLRREFVEPVPVRKKKKYAPCPMVRSISESSLRTAIRCRCLVGGAVTYATLLKAARLLGVDTSKF